MRNPSLGPPTSRTLAPPHVPPRVPPRVLFCSAACKADVSHPIGEEATGIVQVAAEATCTTTGDYVVANVSVGIYNESNRHN